MYEDEQFGVKTFYKSPLGTVFDNLLMPHVHQCLGDVTGLNILVIGQHPPSTVKLENNSRQIQFKNFNGLSVFPYSDDIFDRVIVMHSLEFTEHTKGFLREVWRITAPEGSAVFVIPNRRGLLARSAITPFGFGQPFTKNQLISILGENQFITQSFLAGLCMPVWSLQRHQKILHFLDRLGQFLWPQFCGVYIVGVKKQVYGLTPTPDKAKPAIRPATVSSPS